MNEVLYDDFKKLNGTEEISARYCLIKDNKIIGRCSSTEVDRIREADKIVSLSSINFNLLKGEYLMDLKDSLPRMQDINKINFVSANECEVIIAVSHKWMSSDHPDPESKQLYQIQMWIKKNLTGLSNVGVFLDFCCLPQNNRTKLEQIFFDECLESIELIYFLSDYVIVPSVGLDLYDNSTWCLFESCLSTMANNFVPINSTYKSKFLDGVPPIDKIMTLIDSTTTLCPQDKKVILRRWTDVLSNFNIKIISKEKAHRSVKKITKDETHDLNVIIPKWSTNGIRENRKTMNKSLSSDQETIVNSLVDKHGPKLKMEFFQMCACFCFCKDKWMSVNKLILELNKAGFMVLDNSDYINFNLNVSCKSTVEGKINVNINNIPDETRKLIFKMYGNFTNMLKLTKSGFIDEEIFESLHNTKSIEIF
jgi:hypothetical protein